MSHLKRIQLESQTDSTETIEKALDDIREQIRDGMMEMRRAADDPAEFVNLLIFHFPKVLDECGFLSKVDRLDLALSQTQIKEYLGECETWERDHFEGDFMSALTSILIELGVSLRTIARNTSKAHDHMKQEWCL